MRLLAQAFKETLRSSLYVLKSLSLYFGFYFFGFSLAAWALCFLFGVSFVTESSQGAALFQVALLSLSKAFTVFMVPFYAYKESRSAPPFWTFISENVWPVVLNSIKAFFVIIFFLILLIIPGLYKAIRLTFLVESVVFNKNKIKGALKTASSATKGYFWWVVLFLFLGSALSIIPAKAFFLMPMPLKAGLSLVAGFYFSCFLSLFRVKFYFKIMEEKGQEVSL